MKNYRRTSYNNNTINKKCFGCYWHDMYTEKITCRNPYKCVNNEKYKNNN